MKFSTIKAFLLIEALLFTLSFSSEAASKEQGTNEDQDGKEHFVVSSSINTTLGFTLFREGLVFGQSTKSSLKGLFWSSIDFDILMGAGGLQDRNYPTDVESFSSKSIPLYNLIKNSSAPFLGFRYEDPLRYVFTTNFHKRIKKVLAPEKGGFKDSGAYKLFGNYFGGIKNEWRGWKADTTRTGKIVRVVRWGIFKKDCSVYLHEGGSRNEVYYEIDHGVTETIGGAGISLGAAQVRVKKERKVPNITIHNMYTEEGCRYAEATGLYNKVVRIDSSEKLFHYWVPNILHSIRVLDTVVN